MPRPTDAEKRAIEERKRKNAAERNVREQRDRQVYDRVQGLVQQSLRRPRETIDLDVILTDLSEARAIALSCFPPQVGPAVNASLAQARLLGLIVEKQEIGRPSEFAEVEQA